MNVEDLDFQKRGVDNNIAALKNWPDWSGQENCSEIKLLLRKKVERAAELENHDPAFLVSSNDWLDGRIVRFSSYCQVSAFYEFNLIPESALTHW